MPRGAKSGLQTPAPHPARLRRGSAEKAPPEPSTAPKCQPPLASGGSRKAPVPCRTGCLGVSSSTAFRANSVGISPRSQRHSG
eukprot:98452-Pyramimonas_sp.AAC.1